MAKLSTSVTVAIITLASAVIVAVLQFVVAPLLQHSRRSEESAQTATSSSVVPSHEPPVASDSNSQAPWRIDERTLLMGQWTGTLSVRLQDSREQELEANMMIDNETGGSLRIVAAGGEKCAIPLLIDSLNGGFVVRADRLRVTQSVPCQQIASTQFQLSRSQLRYVLTAESATASSSSVGGMLHRIDWPCEVGLSTPSPAASTPKTLIEVHNRSMAPVTIEWVDSDGTRRQWHVLTPGGFHRQGTFVQHMWAVSDASGNCIAAAAAPAEIVIGKT